MKNKVSILIVSCDKYRDLWPVFSFYFDKNWPDCQVDKYFLSNNQDSDIKGFNSIAVGKDVSWSSNLHIALNKINTPYVLLMLDDFFIDKKVNNEDFDNIVNDFIACNGNYLKFLVKPKSLIKSSSSYFNVLPPKTLYRTTAVFALWNKKTLVELINKNENPWEFEDKASERSDIYEGFYVVKNNFFKYIHSVVRGKFVNSSYKRILKQHPELINLLTRDVNSVSDEIKLYFKRIRHKFFYMIVPLKQRRFVKSFIKKTYN